MLVIKDQENRLRGIDTRATGSSTRGAAQWDFCRPGGSPPETYPGKKHQLGGHRRHALARIEVHGAAAVVPSGVISVLEGQLALAHPAHAGEIHPAPFRGQDLCDALEFRSTDHEEVGAGGALREVVGVKGTGLDPVLFNSSRTKDRSTSAARWCLL